MQHMTEAFMEMMEYWMPWIMEMLQIIPHGYLEKEGIAWILTGLIIMSALPTIRILICPQIQLWACGLKQIISTLPPETIRAIRQAIEAAIKQVS